MKNGVYRFSLDVLRGGSQMQVTTKKSDTARSFVITLMEGGRPYQLEAGVNAFIIIGRPNMSAILDSCMLDLERSVVTYEFNESTAADEGLNTCEIVVEDESGKRITSASFYMLVAEKVYEDGQVHGLSHKELADTGESDLHPMSSITGLESALSEKMNQENLTYLYSEISKKANEKRVELLNDFFTFEIGSLRESVGTLESQLGAKIDEDVARVQNDSKLYTDGLINPISEKVNNIGNVISTALNADMNKLNGSYPSIVTLHIPKGTWWVNAYVNATSSGDPMVRLGINLEGENENFYLVKDHMEPSTSSDYKYAFGRVVSVANDDGVDANLYFYTSQSSAVKGDGNCYTTGMVAFRII